MQFSEISPFEPLRDVSICPKPLCGAAFKLYENYGIDLTLIYMGLHFVTLVMLWPNVIGGQAHRKYLHSLDSR